MKGESQQGVPDLKAKVAGDVLFALSQLGDGLV